MDVFSYTAWPIDRRGRRQVADDLMIPEEFTAAVVPDGEDWAAEVEVRVNAAGHTEPWKVTIRANGDDRPVSSAMIRAFRLVDVVKAATSCVSETIEVDQNGVVRLAPVMSSSDANRAVRVTRKRPKGRTATADPERLAEVRKVIEDNPGRGTIAVQEAFGPMSRSTAVRLVRKARADAAGQEEDNR